MGTSALGLHRDLGFLRGRQGQQHHDDYNEEDDNEVEDIDKDNVNNKDNNNNNDKGISALRLDRDMGFLLEHKGHHH